MKTLLSTRLAWLAGAVFMAAGALAQAQDNALNPREFTLSMELVRAYVEASENVYVELSANPSLLDGMSEATEEFGTERELREMVEFVNSTPVVREAIERAGVSVREYALINATLIPAFITFQMHAAGMGNGSMFEWVTAEHLQFIESNAEAIAEQFERLQMMAPPEPD